MSFQPKPAEIADEILQRIAYSIDTDIDEFSINRYIQKIRNILNHRSLTPKEYEALGMLYFAQKRYEQFKETMEEGLKQNPNNIQLLSSYYIGLFSIAQFGVKDIDFDLYDKWFNHPAITEKMSLKISSGSMWCEIYDKKVIFEKTLRMEIIFNKDKSIEVKTGPFKIEVEYDKMKKIKFDFSDIVLVDFLNRFSCGKVSREEVSYVREILGNENFAYIESIAFSDPNEDTLKAIESKDYDDEYSSIDELFESLSIN